jgi:hypothetical protein
MLALHLKACFNLSNPEQVTRPSGKHQRREAMDQRQRNELDRYITGNYGEDSVAREPVLRPKASINDCERLAQDTDSFDTATFEIVGPSGRVKARWRDAYMGILEIEGQSGFCMSRDFDRPDFWCENFSAATPA